MQSVYRPTAAFLLTSLLAMRLAAGPSLAAAEIEAADRSVAAPGLIPIQSLPGTETELQAIDRGRWESPTGPLEERFLADAADGRLDEFSALGAALIASGAADAACLDRYQQKAAALVEELRCTGKLTDAPRQQAQAVFEFLHRRILRGRYDLAYSDPRRVLDDGCYNCVSATVLFNYLAGEIGLECRGLAMPGHAMSRIHLPEGMLDVENTCPRWFSLNGASQRLATDIRLSSGQGTKSLNTSEPSASHESRGVGRQTTALTTSSVGDPADPSPGREVSAIQLAAMIYYNRGVDLLNKKHFAEAASVNSKALQLDPTAAARGNMLATINNWSIALGNARRFAEAVRLLQRGLAMDGKFAAFTQNYVHVHRQWVEQLCSEGRFAEADDVLRRAKARMPDQAYFSSQARP